MAGGEPCPNQGHTRPRLRGNVSAMLESAADLVWLQALLDRSYVHAGKHLRSIFTENARLTAAEVTGALTGIFEMHLATIAADGAPLVAPVDAVFFRGKVWFGFPPAALRSRLVRRDPRVSASYTRGESFAFIVHGVAREVLESDPFFAAYSDYITELYVKAYGPGWIKWREKNRGQPGEQYVGYIEPRRMYVKK